MQNKTIYIGLAINFILIYRSLENDGDIYITYFSILSFLCFYLLAVKRQINIRKKIKKDRKK